MISDVFKIIAANAKHTEVGFLTNRGIMISAVDSSLVNASLVLETSASIDFHHPWISVEPLRKYLVRVLLKLESLLAIQRILLWAT